MMQCGKKSLASKLPFSHSEGLGGYMKKVSSKKILSILLIAVVGIFTYLYFSSAYSEQDLKAIDIQLINGNADSEINNQDNQDNFLLSPVERAQLFQALTSVTKGDYKPQQITHQYNMVLSSRWGFSKEYSVLFTENTIVLLQDHQSNLYKVEKPDFFYNHKGFYHIYSDRLPPVMQVTLNEDQVLFNKINEHWNYQKHDGQWRTQNFDLNSETEISENVTILSSDDKLSVGTDKAPDNAHLKIVNLATDKVAEAEQVDLSQLPFPNMNGNFSYELSMSWIDETKLYRGESVINIPVLIDFPEKFVFSKQRLIQGDMLEVSVYHVGNMEDIIFEQSIYKEFHWYKQDGFIRGYIPTNYSIQPGRYQIKYGNRKKGTEFSQEIEIVAHNYQIQHLVIDEQIEQETRNDAAYDEFAKYFTPVRKQSEPERYYTEPFTLPTKGRLTTEFGQTRYVNGAPTSYRHSGLDIAAPTGTEIKAVNRGKVVLAMPLTLTGNTIIIDHGEGLFSVYYHMHENFMAVGEMVEQGQKIGTVGTTGFSTGPHLHFTMSYYNMNIEPGFFIVGQPITFANYQKHF